MSRAIERPLNVPKRTLASHSRTRLVTGRARCLDGRSGSGPDNDRTATSIIDLGTPIGHTDRSFRSGTAGILDFCKRANFSPHPPEHRSPRPAIAMRAGGFPAKAGIYSSARAWIFARVAGFAVAELVHCLGVNGITAFERQDPRASRPKLTEQFRP